MINVLFMGRKAVAAKCLEYLIGLENIKVVGLLTDNHLSHSPNSVIAQDNSIPIYGFDEALNKTKTGELQYDIGLSMLYWKILKGGLISTPKFGTINFHPAPLPEYKGTAGYNLAILHGLNKWGITAHYIDERIDTGHIINVDRFNIDKNTETAKSLESICQIKLFEQFKCVFDDFISFPRILPSVPNIGGTYYSREDMELMKEVGPGDDVSRKIRAFWFPPYDGAYVIVNGVKCTLVDRFILNHLASPDESSLFTPKVK